RSLDGPWLLYDNRNDPYQLDNLAGKSDHVALQTRLDTVLQRKLKETDDEFLPGRHYVEKWGYKTDASGTVPYTP
ncbi:MAG: sulfatase, partial [Planctomycetes bacterium]|nr:sulfatase [Planctomycetota bacterium]